MLLSTNVSFQRVSYEYFVIPNITHVLLSITDLALNCKRKNLMRMHSTTFSIFSKTDFPVIRKVVINGLSSCMKNGWFDLHSYFGQIK